MMKMEEREPPIMEWTLLNLKRDEYSAIQTQSGIYVYIGEVNRLIKARDKQNKYVMKDMNGLDLFEGDEFDFVYFDTEKDSIFLKGSFCWNDDELRYEVEVFGRHDYTCLWYDVENMMDFKKLEG